jgi:hypothetical protein
MPYDDDHDGSSAIEIYAMLIYIKGKTKKYHAVGTIQNKISKL